MKLRVELPWPDQALSPNSRSHHMALHRAKKAAKEATMWATKAAIGRATYPHDGESRIELRQIAHPPEVDSLGRRMNRAYDDDNLDASLKAARDGFAIALGVNDQFLRPMGIDWAEPKGRGMIVFEVGHE